MAKPAPATSSSEPEAAATQVADPIAPASTAYAAYPPYVVEFSGDGMPKPIKVTGPHTFALLQPGGGTVTVSLSRNAPDGGRPNLSIKFT